MARMLNLGNIFELVNNSKKRSLDLVEFALSRAITSLKAGQPVIPVWLNLIHQQLRLQ